MSDTPATPAPGKGDAQFVPLERPPSAQPPVADATPGEPPVLTEALDAQAAAEAQAVNAPLPPSLKQVADLTMESAELASRSAEAAASASADLRMAQEALRKVQATALRNTQIVLGAGGAVMLVCLVFFVIVGVRMNSRINQLDATLEAVAREVVELDAGVSSMAAMKDAMAAMAKEVEGLAKTSAGVGGRLEEAARQTEALAQQIPARTAQQVATTTQGMGRQVEALGARVQAQAGTLQALSRDVQALKGTVGNVDRLNRDVQALVTLQRERYLEAVQKAQPAAEAAQREAARDRMVQWPRQQPAASPNAGTR